jgi:hypothetical protein
MSDDLNGGAALPGHAPIDAALGRCEPFSDASPDPTFALENAGADAVWEIELR